MNNGGKHSSDLQDRHESEKLFHDMVYEDHINYPCHYRLHPTYFIFQEMKRMMGEIQGKKILEYGCGEGWTTVEIANLGATIESFDISAVAIEHARKFLKDHGVDHLCSLKTMAAEYLDYPDESFDIVTGFAILHHLDLERAIPELFRVMKPGGLAYFAEPLGTNPLLNLYRRLTPQHRTIDEKPLMLKEFSHYISIFQEYNHREYYLTALAPLGLSYLPISLKIIQPILQQCLKFDKILLSQFPSLGKYAWYSIITLKK